MDSLDIKYNDIDSSIFEIEIDGSQKINRNKVTGSLSKGRAIASSTTLFGVVVWSMVFSTFKLDPSKEQFEDQMVAAANYAAKMAGDIGIIVWQFMRGMFGAHKIVSKQITAPLSVRVKVLKTYYSWRQKNGKEVPLCYKNLTKEEKEEVEEITMTQEEYKKFLEAKEKEVE